MLSAASRSQFDKKNPTKTLHFIKILAQIKNSSKCKCQHRGPKKFCQYISAVIDGHAYIRPRIRLAPSLSRMGFDRVYPVYYEISFD
jgi:hypothetical protein